MANGSSQVWDSFVLNVSETAGGGITKLIKRMTTIPIPSCMRFETAGGVTTKLVERNTTSKHPRLLPARD